MDRGLLDTDMLNGVLKKKNRNVTRRAAAYLADHGKFAISAITRYEALRGLKEKNATAQLARFNVFCAYAIVLPVSDELFDTAADLWVEGRRRGLTPKDADLIIGATTMHQHRTLVRGNTAHFVWIPGLKIENWRDA